MKLILALSLIIYLNLVNLNAQQHILKKEVKISKDYILSKFKVSNNSPFGVPCRYDSIYYYSQRGKLNTWILGSREKNSYVLPESERPCL